MNSVIILKSDDFISCQSLIANPFHPLMNKMCLSQHLLKFIAFLIMH